MSYHARSNKSFPKDLPFVARLNSLIGKLVTVTFDNGHQLVGKLVGIDQRHLNLMLRVKEKLVVVRGSAVLLINEGVDATIPEVVKHG